MEAFEVSNPAPRTFRLRGELDIATVPRLLDVVAPVLDEPGDLVFDLHELSFMDTTAIHAFVRIAEPIVDGSLLLRGPQHIVKKVLQITSIEGRGNIRVLGNGGEPEQAESDSSP